MSYRAAVILIEHEQIALVERHRQGLHYFTFPGGHVEPTETPEQAAVRETLEELGLQVVILRLVAEVWWNGQPQYYYLVGSTGGTFGSGTGEELSHPLPGKGTYIPMWMSLAEILIQNVLPRSVARIVAGAQTSGWPDPPIVLHEHD